MSHILRAHFRNKDASPLTVTDLLAQGSRFVEIFRNEHMIPYDHDKPRMYERVNFFIENKGILWAQGQEGTAIVMNSEGSRLFLDYFCFVT